MKNATEGTVTATANVVSLGIAKPGSTAGRSWMSPSGPNDFEAGYVWQPGHVAGLVMRARPNI